MTKKVVGRLVPTPINDESIDTGLFIDGEFNERFPITPERKKFRYVRNTLNGNSENPYNHWIEIQVYSKGFNVALGKTVTPSHPVTTPVPISAITDGVLETGKYATAGGANTKSYVTIDLGTGYEIDYIQMWHYYGDGRTYKENAILVSEDGVKWYTVFDSEKGGQYAETKDGKIIYLPSFGLKHHSDFCYGTDLSYHRRNLIDFDEITKRPITGSMEFTNFGATGNTSFTTVENPFMPGSYEPTVYTKTLESNVTVNYNGGLNTRNYPIDNTKTYRVTCLFKRKTGASSYLGLTSASNVIPLNSTTVSTNPYFAYFNTAVLPEIRNNEWFMMVYHIHPVGYTGLIHNDSGIYKLSDHFSRNKLGMPVTKITSPSSHTDFRWTSSSTVAGVRAMMYYSTIANDEHWICRPTLEEVDDATLPIEYLLSGATVDNVSLQLLAPTALTDEGAYFTHTSKNISSGNYMTYNNPTIPVSVKELEETYNGMPIYRYTFKPTTEEHLLGLYNSLGSTGVSSNVKYTFKANTRYCASLYMRKVSNHNMKFGGTASNIQGWTAGVIPCNDGWNRNFQYRDGSVTEDKEDLVFFSIKTTIGEVKIGDKVIFDVCGLAVEEGYMHPTKPIIGNGTVTKPTLSLPLKLKAPFTVNVKGKVIRSSVDMGGVQANYPVLIQLGAYHKNNSATLWRYGNNISLYGLGNNNATTTWDMNNGISTFHDEKILMKENTYTLVMENSLDFKVYINGELVMTSTSKDVFGEFDRISFNVSNGGATLLRELTILDYAIDESEVKRIFGKGFSITPDGDVFKNRLVEKSLDTTYRPIHFPLLDNYKDTTGEYTINYKTPEGEFIDGLELYNGTRNASLFNTSTLFDTNLYRYYTLGQGKVSTSGVITAPGVIRGYSEQSKAIIKVETNSPNAHPYGNGEFGLVSKVSNPISSNSAFDGVVSSAFNPFNYFTYGRYYHVAVKVKREDGEPITVDNTLMPYFDDIGFSVSSASWYASIPDGDGWYTLLSTGTAYIPNSTYVSDNPSYYTYEREYWGRKFNDVNYIGVGVNPGETVYVDSIHVYESTSDKAFIPTSPKSLNAPINLNLKTSFNISINDAFTVVFDKYVKQPFNTSTTPIAGTANDTFFLGDTAHLQSLTQRRGNWYRVMFSSKGDGIVEYKVHDLTNNTAMTTTNITNLDISATDKDPKIFIGNSGDVKIRNLKVYPNQYLSYSDIKDIHQKDLMRISGDELQINNMFKEGGIV